MTNDDVVTARVYAVPACGCSNDYLERTGLHHEGCLLGLAGRPDPEVTPDQLSVVHLRVLP